jgi:coatomer protein complex subunit alpha (xenin)
VRVKGGTWDDTRPVFVYTTANHIKYVLANGDKGILRALDTPMYVTKVVGSNLYCLDREVKARTIEVDVTEALFKLALEKKDYPEVGTILDSVRRFR